MKVATNYVPLPFKNTPEALTFLIRFGPGVFHHSVFLLLLYLAERTLTYRKDADSTSYRQMTGGAVMRDGGAIRTGSGIQKTAAAEAAKALDALGIVRRVKGLGEGGKSGITRYRIDWQRLFEYVREKVGKLETRWEELVRQPNSGGSPAEQEPSAERTPISSPSGHTVVDGTAVDKQNKDRQKSPPLCPKCKDWGLLPTERGKRQSESFCDCSNGDEARTEWEANQRSKPTAESQYEAYGDYE